MQAILLQNGTVDRLENYPQPTLELGHALIRMTLAGICSTDLALIKGYKQNEKIVLGHEFVGTVTAVADSTDRDWIGRRVVGSINILPQPVQDKTAGEVELLAKHDPSRAALGIFGQDGAFADFFTLPVQNLWVIPDDVTDEAAVFAEPLAAALEIREQVNIRPSMKTAVIGPGRLGMLCGAVLHEAGADVTMLGRRQASLMLAQHWGLKTALTDEIAPNSLDLIVEATGNEAGVNHALRLVRPKGTVILKSTFAGKTTFDLSKVVVNEISLIGSRCGPFGPAIRLLAQNKIDVVSMIDGRYPLSQYKEAFSHAAQSGIRKILLYP